MNAVQTFGGSTVHVARYSSRIKPSHGRAGRDCKHDRTVTSTTVICVVCVCLTVERKRLKWLLTCADVRRDHSALSAVEWCIDPFVWPRTEPTHLIKRC
jgi:hypothetical protein